MTPRGLRRFGTGALLLAMAMTAGVAVAAADVWGWPGAVWLFLFPLWPALALLCWHRDMGATAWGLLAVLAFESFVFGLSWGGLMVYAVVPFAAGNVAFRWAARAAHATPTPDASA